MYTWLSSYQVGYFKRYTSGAGSHMTQNAVNEFIRNFEKHYNSNVKVNVSPGPMIAASRNNGAAARDSSMSRLETKF